MVWFECQCGESLKKPHVGRHLQFKHCEYVTCVDCSVVFHGTDYDAHTKCISEAEKYMGSLYNGPGKKEGQKQNDWLQTVTDILAAYKGPHRDFAQRLKNYDNIPRKEKAFLAFVSNSLGLRDQRTAAELWKLIDVRPKTWSGWEAELRMILVAHGGKLHWKKLGKEAAKKYLQLKPEKMPRSIPTSEKALFNLAVSSIPDEWITDASTVVSVPLPIEQAPLPLQNRF